MSAEPPAVRAEGLRKDYGETRALDGLDLEVPAGTVFGLLGPNGAGKTTAVRVLATLLRPDAGRAEVAGHDVVRRADRVRAAIGLTGQYASVDELLTGRENLVMFARLYGLDPRAARERAEELLERFDLTHAADRRSDGYSGGMRRRLDLAVSLIQRPRVLFLDEPTTGLDPRSRLGVWESVRSLVSTGTTVVLTTQYLEEADRLADTVAVIDHGRAIAGGTPDALRSRVGGDRLDVVVRDPADLSTVAALLGAALDAPATVHREEQRVSLPAPDRLAVLTGAVRALEDSTAAIADIGVRRPSLDEVFLALTGHDTDAATGAGTARPLPA
ncbi:ATP-binding cassette domain-containing protein [Nocardiopsis changdeensis]|uniref:ATP-binding cassette domain-containing protein n=1 Tax=Nocardiopsis changdeensis TaxID=2831969 RepID=A0ABX8BFR6_9ACTN|nr:MULTISPECIES: ATP-binding cassette domain-containing protein [Nocardiopsis]QUX20904.1 ATP-binding cassette domain-containing protein [Nocardiopsis changdeensis]QYX36835.1 ATP-binding cassette domain-containing protein [Nocardiopsis sp. MT53]